MRIPEPNEIYRHFKGGLYRILTLAEHTETGERLVIYQALYGDCRVYARPLEAFQSRVDHVKYPDVQEEYRFTLLPPFYQGGGASRSAEASVALEFPQASRAMEPPRDFQAAEHSQDVRAAELSQDFQAAEPPQDAEACESLGEFVLDPRLADFLDADTYREKLEIFAAMHDTVTDDMLNTLAAALDLELEPGAVEERYQTLKNCLLTLEKYECSRLR